MDYVPFPRPDEPLASSHVEFPDVTSNPRRIPHLPFRRMSLISVRTSMDMNTSTLSALNQSQTSSKAVAPSTPTSPQRPNRRARPSSIARPTSNEDLKGMNFPNIMETQEIRDNRRNVLFEFRDTERTYLQGLDLIYFVRQNFYASRGKWYECLK
jgi:hypothetical protein